MNGSADSKIRFFSAFATIIISCSIPYSAISQISHGGKPYGYSLKSSADLEFVHMPYVDNDALIARDQYTWEKKGPFRFAERMDVDMGLAWSLQLHYLNRERQIWSVSITIRYTILSGYPISLKSNVLKFSVLPVSCF